MSINITWDWYCLHVIAAGQVYLEAEPNISAHLSPGDMFAIWPGVRFMFRSEPVEDGPDVDLYWIRIIGPLAAEYMKAMGFARDRLHFRARDPDRVRGITEELMELAMAYDDATDFRAISLLHELPPLCQFVRPASAGEPSLVERARMLMEREVSTGMNIEQICRVLKVSRSSLFLHFRKECGRSPIEVLTELRIAHAKRLLASTDLSVAEVAFSSGYTDAFYFSRMFAREVGRPPSRFREEESKRKV
ncbi:MAG: AraC family transcriptional regulator [Planctomycetes bacterium]|nr:AraC family transcriptional regulator [Planctomycetota bacterium]